VSHLSANISSAEQQLLLLAAAPSHKHAGAITAVNKEPLQATDCVDVTHSYVNSQSQLNAVTAVKHSSVINK